MSTIPKKNGKILLEAFTIINKTRQNEYGSPSDSLKRIAEMWSAYIGEPLTASDVANMMALLKIAREAHSHKKDNILDAIGYLGIASDLARD